MSKGTGMNRVLGRSGIEVSAIGFGCWAIGGPVTMDGKPDGWGDADDDESAAALRRALELGGAPAKLPPTRPWLARNSAMVRWLNWSAGLVNDCPLVGRGCPEERLAATRGSQ